MEVGLPRSVSVSNADRTAPAPKRYKTLACTFVFLSKIHFPLRVCLGIMDLHLLHFFSSRLKAKIIISLNNQSDFYLNIITIIIGYKLELRIASIINGLNLFRVIL